MRTEWFPMSIAPEDRPLLVKYDHDADPYQDPNNTGLLTNYAANAEMGDFLEGKGVCIAHFCPQEWESTDDYGNDGYWIPECWLVWLGDDYTETVVNAVGWMPLPKFE